MIKEPNLSVSLKSNSEELSFGQTSRKMLDTLPKETKTAKSQDILQNSPPFQPPHPPNASLQEMCQINAHWLHKSKIRNLIRKGVDQRQSPEQISGIEGGGIED